MNLNIYHAVENGVIASSAHVKSHMCASAESEVGGFVEQKLSRLTGSI